jgi:hypothetical protein
MNLYDRNPVQIDQAFTSYKSAVRLTQGSPLTFICTLVRWIAPGSAGDQLEIVDPQSGNQLLLVVCKTPGQDIEVNFTSSPRIWGDWGIPQISSGKAMIFAK